MSATATAASTDQTGEQLTLDIAGVTAWVETQRQTVAEWREQGQRYENFVAKNDEATVAAFGEFIDDLEAGVNAIVEGKIPGRSTYTARDLLVDVRHLRDLNRNLVRENKTDTVAVRVVAPRGKIGWGVAEATGSPAAYAHVADNTAKTLAQAIKADERAAA